MMRMRMTMRRTAIALSVVAALAGGSLAAWDRLSATILHPTQVELPRPAAEQIPDQQGSGAGAMTNPMTEQLTTGASRQAQMMPTLAPGRYVGRVHAVLAGDHQRMSMNVETSIDETKIRHAGSRVLEVAADARVRLNGSGKPARLTFAEFAERFNDTSARSAKIRALRYWIEVGHGRVTAMGDHGPRYSSPLEAGDHGRAVTALQKRLAELHYDVGEIDGRFGYDTTHAVVAFQKVNDLDRDGTVDRRLWKAMYDPAVPKLQRKGKKRRVEIDLTRQVLYLIDGRRAVRIVDVSSGGGLQSYADGSEHIASTPTGDFHVFQHIPGWYESSVGPMYESNFFATHIAIHGSGSVPPYPASHGCVRVTVSGMDRLLPELYVGMPVSVYRT
jgi:N-acetylmuramoyl-L-alanine amidase